MKYSIIPNQTKEGIVKAVHDGDSIKVLFDDGEVSWIRIWGIDAPEVFSNHVGANQPFGKESGQALRDLTKGNRVEVQTLFSDQFNRMICKVKLINLTDRRLDIDLTWFQIVKGFAWWLPEPKMTSDERTWLKGWHDTAKSDKVGLWADPGRKLRPSTWRERNRLFNLSSEFEDLSL